MNQRIPERKPPVGWAPLPRSRKWVRLFRSRQNTDDSRTTRNPMRYFHHGFALESPSKRKNLKRDTPDLWLQIKYYSPKMGLSFQLVYQPKQKHKGTAGVSLSWSPVSLSFSQTELLTKSYTPMQLTVQPLAFEQDSLLFAATLKMIRTQKLRT